FQLPTQCGESYAFKTSRGWMKMLRSPMGEKSQVFIAHTISTSLARIVKARVDAPGAPISFDVIIDNVAFFTNDEEQLTRACTIFKQLCSECSITIGEESAP